MIKRFYLLLLAIVASVGMMNAKVTWNSSNISDLKARSYQSYSKEGVTLSANSDMVEARWQDFGDESHDGISFNANETGGYTFSNTLGKNFTKIEMTLNGPGGWDMANLGSGWSFSWDFMNDKPATVTWTGNASTVDLLKEASDFGGEQVKSIVFYFEGDSQEATTAVTGVTLDKSAAELTVGGENLTLIPTVLPSNATNKEVMWNSDNGYVAVVENGGVVIPVGPGTANITVTTVDGDYSATCVVTVSNPAPTYTVALKEGTANADKVTLSATSAVEGATVTVTPDDEYEITAFSAYYVVVEDQLGSIYDIDATLNTETGAYSFTMPAYAVTIEATIAEKAAPAPAATVTWNSSNISDLQVNGNSYSKEGITLSPNASNNYAYWLDYGNESQNGIYFYVNATGGHTFSNSLGKNFTKIEMTLNGLDGWYVAYLGSGWNIDGMKVIWTGNASTVDLLTETSSFGGAAGVKSIVFYFEGGSEDPAPANVCGDGLTWELSEGVLTISYDGVGTGEMTDFDYEYDESPVNVAPWKENKSAITTVIVGDGVKSIGNYAFNDLYENFTAVTIANSVERIGLNAFMNAKWITEITLPSSLKTIDKECFAANFGFTSITIPSGVTSIGNKAFSYCNGLTSLTCEATTPPTLASSVFYKVRSKTSDMSNIPLYVPSESVDAYTAAAQWNAFDVQAIPGGGSTPANSCGDGVIWELNDGALTISYTGTGTGVMDNYASLSDAPWYSHKDDITSVTITDGVKSVGSNSFGYYENLVTVTIGNDVETIGYYAFGDCYKFTTLNLGNSIKHIGDRAFMWAKVLTGFTLPSTLETIGERAFLQNKVITSLTIPSSVTSIGQSAFMYCAALTSVTVEATTPPTLGETVFEGVPTSSIPLHVPSGSVAAYTAADQWKDFDIQDPTPAYEKAINLINAIGTVELTAECKAKIDAARAAFIALSDGDKDLVTNIATLTTAEAAFDNVMDIWLSGDCDVILWSDTTLTVRKHAGEGNGAMKDYSDYYGDDLAPWYSDRWYDPQPGDIIIKSITIEEGVTHICTNGFGWVYDLKTVTIPASMTSIPNNAFYWSRAVDDVYCYADPANLDWSVGNMSSGNFKENKATLCHVPVDMLAAYQDKFAEINVTFVGDLAPVVPPTPEEQAAIDAVKGLITAIPQPVVYTDACKAAIDTARAAYDALATNVMKLLVDNYNVLTAAEDAYAQARIDTEAAAPVIALINELPNPMSDAYLKLSVYDKLVPASDAFNALTEAQKALVTNADVLAAVKAAFDALGGGGKVPATGFLKGKFSVAENSQICFAKGNLQASTETYGAQWTWSFAEHQYDYIGNAAANTAVNGNKTVSTNGTIDLLGWSAESTYYGINNSANPSDYTGEFVDWGNRAITNGGNTANAGWRTLEYSEWYYLLFTRTNAAQLFGLGSVNGKNGVILLPDDWTTPAGVEFHSGAEMGMEVQGVKYQHDGGAGPDPNDYEDNTYTVDQWALMEAAGAVFLPAAGDRYETTVAHVNEEGHYWSSTAHEQNAVFSYETRILQNMLSPGFAYGKPMGYSVRLVAAVNPIADAQAALALINAIPSPVTMDSKDAIDAARAAVDALGENASLIDDADMAKLTQAEADYQALNQAIVDAVIAKIDSLPNPMTEADLKLSVYDKVAGARAAYDALTDYQKALVTNYSILTAAEAAFDALNQGGSVPVEIVWDKNTGIARVDQGNTSPAYEGMTVTVGSGSAFDVNPEGRFNFTFYAQPNGGFTFANVDGFNITKVVIESATALTSTMTEVERMGSGWAISNENTTATWTGDADSVSIWKGQSFTNYWYVDVITFTVNGVGATPIAMAQAALALINAIPAEIEKTAECKAAIDAARAAVDALGENVSLLEDSDLAKLTNAEAVYASLPWGVWTSGDCEVKIYDDSTMVVSKLPGEGNGAMANYGSWSSVPWQAHRNAVDSLVIEEGVTVLGKYAFYALNIKGALVIPEGVTTLSENTFYGSSKVTSITLPTTITHIAEQYNAFYGCTGVTDVYLPANPLNLTWIDDNDDFIREPAKSTVCHVPADCYDAYVAKFDATVNVTFAGDLAVALPEAMRDSINHVKDLIDAIPDPVVYTEDCKAAIDTAYAAYYELNENLRLFIGNFGDLLYAEAAYAQAKTDHEAADSVIALINEIPQPATAKLSVYNKVVPAREAYDALTDAQKALVTNYSTLTDAEALFEGLTGGGTGVESLLTTITVSNNVVNHSVENIVDINQDAAVLGENGWTSGMVEVSAKPGFTITNVRYFQNDGMFGAVGDVTSSPFEVRITNGMTLVKLEVYGYEALSPIAAAQAAVDLINAIPDTITLSSKGAIDAARAAVDALDDVAASLIDQDDLDKLTQAEADYAALIKAATDVIDLIDAIPSPVVYTEDCKAAIDTARAAYDALSDELKELVTNSAHLQDAEAAMNVVTKIEALPDPLTLTISTKHAIEDARAAYDALTGDRKALISADELQKLTDAEAAWALLAEGHEDELAAAEAIAELIEAIPQPVEYTEPCGAAIAAADTAYSKADSLTRAMIGEPLVQVLTNAVTEYAALEAIAAIEAIPDSIYYDAAIKTAIATAVNTFAELSDASKALVSDSLQNKLTNAAATWAALAAKVEHNVTYIGKDGELKNEIVCLFNIPDTVPDVNGYEFAYWNVKTTELYYEGVQIKAIYSPIITTDPAPYDTLVYNGVAQTLIAAAEAKEGHVEYTLTPQDSTSWSSELPTATNAGLYAVSYKLVREGHDDYLVPEPVFAEIAKAPVTYTAPVAYDSLAYNAQMQTLIIGGYTEDGTFRYSLNPADAESWSADLPQYMHADTLAVAFRIDGDANHLDSIAPYSVQAIIAKAELTATADDKTVIYGDSIPDYTVTYAGWLGADTLDVLFGDIAFNCEYAPTSNVGEYAIAPSGVSAHDYAITFVNGKVSVNQAILTVTADDKTVTYGDAVPEYTVSYSGWKNGDTTDVVSNLQFICEYAPTSNVGEYVIAADSAQALNYAMNYVTGKLTVNKADLTITPIDKTVTYGDSIPEYDVFYTGFHNNDTADVVSNLVLTCAYEPTGNVGEYTITADSAQATNYNISYNTGKLTVEQALMIVVAEDKNVIYGDPVPTYTPAYFGWRNDDSTRVAELISGLQFACEYAPTSNVGEYTITADSAKAMNYRFEYVAGKLTVAKAALTITANDTVMIYGDAAPEFTASYSGWKNDDNATVVSGLKFTTPYNPGSHIGTYDIVPSDATAENYAISFVNGKLTVNKAVVYVSDAEAQIAKFADGHAGAEVLKAGTLNGIKLNDAVTHITTAAFSSAEVSEHLTITLFYELSGDATLLNDYLLTPTSEVFTTEGVIIEPFIPDTTRTEEHDEDQTEVQEGISVYAYGYCEGDNVGLKYHLNSGNPDQYKIEFEDSRFTNVDWTNLDIAGKDGVIYIDIPVDVPTGDYQMTVYFRDSRFDWLESQKLIVTFHVNLPETYVQPLFGNTIVLIDTCECFTDIQWYYRANSSDPWQPIPGATGHYYHADGKLEGEYFVKAKMNGVETYTCGQEDMQTLFGDDNKRQIVRAYPNPVVTTTVVTIENSDSYEHTLRIVNLSGVEFEKTTFEGNETVVDMNGYVIGNYMISVDGIVVKVMKK